MAAPVESVTAASSSARRSVNILIASSIVVPDAMFVPFSRCPGLAGVMTASTWIDPPAVHLLDEVGDVIVRRSKDDVLTGALLNDLAVAQNCDLVTQPQGLVEIVSDEHDRLLDLLLQVQKNAFACPS